MISLILFIALCVLLLTGYPVAFCLAGVALLSALLGNIAGIFDLSILTFMPDRVFGIITNQTLLAVPLFILMGITLERAKIAEKLLKVMEHLFGKYPGGLALAVICVGALLAASTGIVGAVVVTLGTLALPTMLQRNYDPKLATGVICATGTLGQIIPPSIALVLLGDVLSNAHQKVSVEQGLFSTKTLTVGDLFQGALIPGLLLAGFYMAVVILYLARNPGAMPPAPKMKRPNIQDIVLTFLTPLSLILLVLGSIISGIATPTEASAVGAVGALMLALGNRSLTLTSFLDIGREAMTTSVMIFTILICASLFSLVFRGFGGEEWIQAVFEHMPGGTTGTLAAVMLLLFLLGFFLDFIEITFIAIPIIAPILFRMGIDPTWLGVMIAINLQTSFLTPPFGFALFYMRSVTPKEIPTSNLYKGVLPFIAAQTALLLLVWRFPELVQL